MAMARGSKIWMAATLGGTWMLSLGSTTTKMQLVRFGHGATGRRCSSSPTFLKINNENWLTPMLPMKGSFVPSLTQGTWCTNANPTEDSTQTRVKARTRPRANRDQLRKVAKRVRQWQPMLLLWVPQGTLGASSAAPRITSSDPVQRGRSQAPSPRARALAMSMWRRRWGTSTASTSTARGASSMSSTSAAASGAAPVNIYTVHAEPDPQFDIPGVISEMVGHVSQPDVSGFAVIDTGATETITSLEALEFVINN